MYCRKNDVDCIDTTTNMDFCCIFQKVDNTCIHVYTLRFFIYVFYLIIIIVYKYEFRTN